MTGLDWIIVAVIAVSGGISVIRGFVKEAISLATWVLAVWVALMFAPKLALLMPDTWQSPMVRWVVSAIGLFMATLLVGGLANFLVSTMVEKTGLTGTDRALGVVFGILRGIAIIAVLVLLVSETTLVEEPWWHESRLVPLFEPLAHWMRTHYPADLAESMLSP